MQRKSLFSLSLKTSLLIGLALLATGASWAQMSGGMGGMGGGMGGRRGHDSSGPRGDKPKDKDAAPTETRIEQINDRLAELKNRLGLSPEQQPQFDKMETRVMAYFLDFTRPAPAVSAQQTAVQYVQQRLTLAQNRYTLMEDVADAVQGLYKGLTPAQQRIVDQSLPGIIPQVDGRPMGAGGDGAGGGRNQRPPPPG
jgi:hypothetical protein